MSVSVDSRIRPLGFDAFCKKAYLTVVSLMISKKCKSCTRLHASERRVMELLLETTILDAELSAERRDGNVGDDFAHSSNPFAHWGTSCLAT